MCNLRRGCSSRTVLIILEGRPCSYYDDQARPSQLEPFNTLYKLEQWPLQRLYLLLVCLGLDQIVHATLALSRRQPQDTLDARI